MRAPLLFLVCAACAPQTEHPLVGMQILARADLNHNGSVDQAEYAQLALPGEGFAPLDQNNDGLLDAAELEAAFLTTNPADVQDIGRQLVHQKYGFPFDDGHRPPHSKGPPPGTPR